MALAATTLGTAAMLQGAITLCKVFISLWYRERDSNSQGVATDGF